MDERQERARDAVQKAYNGICGVLASLDDAAVAGRSMHETRALVEQVRRRLAVEFIETDQAERRADFGGHAP